MFQNTFRTETDEGYVKQKLLKTVFIIFAFLSLLACLGFLVAWQTFAFFEGIVVITCIATVLFQKNRIHSWELYFENDQLYLTNRATGERFEVYNIPASDFVITQTKKEKSLNYCSVLIKDTVFSFGGIKNCSELQKYITENYIS